MQNVICRQFIKRIKCLEFLLGFHILLKGESWYYRGLVHSNLCSSEMGSMEDGWILVFILGHSPQSARWKNNFQPELTCEGVVGRPVNIANWPAVWKAHVLDVPHIAWHTCCEWRPRPVNFQLWGQGGFLQRHIQLSFIWRSLVQKGFFIGRTAYFYYCSRPSDG